MSVRAAVWCLWLAALAPLWAWRSVTWPECSKTNHESIVFRRTVNLEAYWLILDDCNITNLDSDSFSNLPNLREIYLGSNNISQLDVSLFVPVPKLKNLYFAKNMLLGKKLPSQLFHNNRELLLIDFSYSDMTGTPSDLLQGLEKLRTMTLKHCSLRHVPLFVTQPALNRLENLYLDFNSIERLDDPDTFIHLGNLQTLNLPNNSIEYLHEDIFKPLTKLTTILLGNNRIKYITGQLFHSQHFHVIGLKNNLIEYISADAFLHSSFETIYLDANRLTYLPDTIYTAFVPSDNVTKSILFPNNWQCKCLNEILVQLKRRNISYDSTLLDGKHPVCELTDGPCIKNTRIALPFS